MRSRSNRYWVTTAMIAGLVFSLSVTHLNADCPAHGHDAPVLIERLIYPHGQGEGYHIAYCVELPLEIYWQFKTDFHNEFLTGNPQIKMHRFVGREGNAVLTENRYAHDTEKLFRWRTTVYASQYRLNFELLNPDEAGQAFHHGTIQLEASGRHTMIYQKARFQFSGASLWAFYPWRGGMRSFLQSFVDWEREAALTWKTEYEARRRQEALKQARMRQIFSVNRRYPDK